MAYMISDSRQTIPAFFADTVKLRGKQPALAFIRNGELHWRTWQEVAEDAGRLAAAIHAAGIAPGDRVAHVSENRYEWVITDLALHLAGAVHVPIHVTLSGPQIAEQIADCGARMVFVSSEELLAKFVDLLDQRIIVLVHDGPPAAATGHRPRGGRVAGLFAKTQAAPDDLATILYTSGTTGRPRGVMLSQRNLASNAAETADVHGIDAQQTRLGILPLSHIYARTCDLYMWVYRGWRLVLAESRETLERDLQLVQPTGMSAVPFVYQRIAEKVQAGPPEDWATALRKYFGGKMERLSSGGAPLAPHIEAWYAECSLPILAGYGLTETSPVIATSTLSCRRQGSVGPPLPSVEVRIAEDGEILVRGPLVMLGYWRDEAATAEMIRDGWLHTGDLGELDGDGFLYVRGRKKELIVLSTGKKVFPTRVESLLTTSPLIEQAAVFGDGLPAVIALIVPSGCQTATSEERRAKTESIAAEIARCLAAAAHEEQVRQFALLDRPFSIERGEMTAKLSLCRTVIARNFAAELAAIRKLPQRHLERV
ncbi:MAG: AMP-dependent synthetase/ligase [Pirellulales bacterium]